MKKELLITVFEHNVVRTEKIRKITNIKNEIPVWMFKNLINDHRNDCPVCKFPMAKEISHGQSIELCSAIELDHVAVIPIHTECLFQLYNDQNYDPIQKNPEVTILLCNANDK